MRCLATIILVLLLCPYSYAFLYGTQEVDVTYTYEKETFYGAKLASGVSNNVLMEIWIDDLENVSENTYFPLWIHFQHQDMESWWNMQCGAIASEDGMGLHRVLVRCIGNSADPEWIEINDGGIGYINGKIVVKADRVILEGTFKGIAPGYYRFGCPVNLKLVSITHVESK